MRHVTNHGEGVGGPLAQNNSGDTPFNGASVRKDLPILSPEVNLLVDLLVHITKSED